MDKIKLPKIRGFLRYVLYQIGINCLVATDKMQCFHFNKLYQIGINCLVATQMDVQLLVLKLYQIGINCLVATEFANAETYPDIISDWN